MALFVRVESAQAQVVEYYHMDGAGNIRLVTGANGLESERRDYLPFGEASVPSPLSQPRAFAGKERDLETGLDYFGARYYQANLGRFSTLDPAQTLEENVEDPQRWNEYAYGRNNPLRFVDVDGRDWLYRKAMTMFLGPQYVQEHGDRSSLELLFSRETLSDIDRGRQAFAEDHQRMFHGLSPVPTTKGEATVTVAMTVVLGPGSGPVRTTLAEAKALLGSWGRGSFGTLAASLRYHFAEHGAEVGARTMLQYLRKAAEFSRTAARNATRYLLENGKIRYVKDGKYVIKDAEQKIISFGAER
jgi:RHS repeat-associated protein